MVTTARYSPRSRNAGSPTKNATPAPARAAAGMANRNGRPWRVAGVMAPDAKAPTPSRLYWPRLSLPGVAHQQVRARVLPPPWRRRCRSGAPSSWSAIRPGPTAAPARWRSGPRRSRWSPCTAGRVNEQSVEHQTALRPRVLPSSPSGRSSSATSTQHEHGEGLDTGQRCVGEHPAGAGLDQTRRPRRPTNAPGSDVSPPTIAAARPNRNNRPSAPGAKAPRPGATSSAPIVREARAGSPHERRHARDGHADEPRRGGVLRGGEHAEAEVGPAQYHGQAERHEQRHHERQDLGGRNHDTGHAHALGRRWGREWTSGWRRDAPIHPTARTAAVRRWRPPP